MLSDPDQGAAIVASGHVSGSLLEDKDGKLKVRARQGPFRIPVKDSCLDDVGRPGVMPHETCPQFGRFQPYTSHPNARVVAESHVSRFLVDDLRWVRGSSNRLRHQCATVADFPMKVPQ